MYQYALGCTSRLSLKQDLLYPALFSLVVSESLHLAEENRALGSGGSWIRRWEKSQRRSVYHIVTAVSARRVVIFPLVSRETSSHLYSELDPNFPACEITLDITHL